MKEESEKEDRIKIWKSKKTRRWKEYIKEVSGEEEHELKQDGGYDKKGTKE